ncbi:uncharacterized protein LOC127280004 [Leptopilina boulardi]|uniref:uncharacterized protein LOC127280004 n=1 Tax=Leptopilina boulardi TaxID=63433 RepID=UPI0021F6595C|nr:uncharacterized protein LOC127280004 [Leptopilina boulardi]
MEITVEETPDDRPKDSRKRRSSIFQRRSILFTDVNSVSEDLEETKIEKSSISPVKQNAEETFDLQAYNDKLKEEIAAWHDVMKERQNEYKKLMKKRAEVKKNGQEVDLTLLSEDERKFFESRPNLDLLMSNVKELMDVTMQNVILNQHCSQRYEYLQFLLEEKMNEAKKKIISMID